MSLWVCLALAASGCGHSLTAQAKVLEPAAVPVRAYPEIWVAGGHLEEDEIVLTALASSLEEGGESRVRRVDPDQLEAQRRAARIPSTAVVVLVDVRVQEDVRTGWDRQPVRVCGAYGCETRYQQVTTNIPWVRGTAQLRVHDGPSARLLQRHVVRTDLYGGDPTVMREKVIAQLARRAVDAVSLVERTVEVELLKVKKLPAVEAALEAIRAGDWTTGRQRLEQAARETQSPQLSADDRARVFYDLGLARRFAPGPDGYSEKAFDASARAFKQASRLDPRPLYERGLQALEAHRQAHARLQEQRKAAAHNFALDRREGEVPPPPPSYLQPLLPETQSIPPPPAPGTEAPPSPQEMAPEEAFEP